MGENRETARLRAEFRDAQFRDADREDVDYYRDRCRTVDGPVLEIGCGTGRVYLELLRAGIDADGLDLSAAALEVLRDRATAAGLDPTVWRADMTDFSVDREYDLVVAPFNAVGNLIDPADQRAMLSAVHDALAPGGAFVFDTFVPGFDYICDTYGEWQERTVEFRETPYTFRTRSRVDDEVHQTFTVEREAVDPDGDSLFEERHQLKLLPYRELRLLVDQSPFGSWAVTGDYTDEPVADGDTVQVWTLRRDE